MVGLGEFVSACFDWAEDRWGKGKGCLFAIAAGLLMIAVFAFIAAYGS